MLCCISQSLPQPAPCRLQRLRYCSCLTPGRGQRVMPPWSAFATAYSSCIILCGGVKGGVALMVNSFFMWRANPDVSKPLLEQHQGSNQGSLSTWFGGCASSSQVLTVCCSHSVATTRACIAVMCCAAPGLGLPNQGLCSHPGGPRPQHQRCRLPPRATHHPHS